MNKTTFDLTASDSRDSYKLLSGLVIPRPIGWIGTVRANGTYNLAPFSFFNVVSTAPPLVIFAAGQHSDRPKDSSSLAEESGEFTVNIVSVDVAPAMNLTSGRFGIEDEEFGQRPAAFVKFSENGRIPEKEIIKELEKSLPRFKIPKIYWEWPEHLTEGALKLPRAEFQKLAAKKSVRNPKRTPAACS